MSLLNFLGLLAFWLVLQVWLLPRLGIATCAVPARPAGGGTSQVADLPTRTLRRPFQEVLAEVQAACQAEGVDVVGEVDVQGRLRQRLGVTGRRYRVLQACYAPLAHEALAADPRAGVALPWSIAVYERDDGQTQVVAVDPVVTLGAVSNAALGQVAGEARDKLRAVLAHLAEAAEPEPLARDSASTAG